MSRRKYTPEFLVQRLIGYFNDNGTLAGISNNPDFKNYYAAAKQPNYFGSKEWFLT